MELRGIAEKRGHKETRKVCVQERIRFEAKAESRESRTVDWREGERKGEGSNGNEELQYSWMER